MLFDGDHLTADLESGGEMDEVDFLETAVVPVVSSRHVVMELDCEMVPDELNQLQSTHHGFFELLKVVDKLCSELNE